ncbi:hypothetical protein [Streptomyces avidinii]
MVVRFDDPLLLLTDDAESPRRLSGWVTAADAETLAERRPARPPTCLIHVQTVPEPAGARGVSRFWY